MLVTSGLTPEPRVESVVLWNVKRTSLERTGVPSCHRASGARRNVMLSESGNSQRGLPGRLIGPEGADVDDFHDVAAGLLEEFLSAAVDLHPAADLVDQAQFLVGVGELAGVVGADCLKADARPGGGWERVTSYDFQRGDFAAARRRPPFRRAADRP